MNYIPNHGLRLTQPFIPPGHVNRVPVSSAVHLWQVICAIPLTVACL